MRLCLLRPNRLVQPHRLVWLLWCGLHARCWSGWHIQNRQVRPLLVPHHHQDRQKDHHHHNKNENCCCNDNDNKHFDDEYHRCHSQYNHNHCNHCNERGNPIFNNQRTDYQSYERSNQQLPFNNDHSFDCPHRTTRRPDDQTTRRHDHSFDWLH